MVNENGTGFPMSLTLYTSPGCHLCEQAEEILDYVGVDFTAVDISSDVDLIRKFGVRIPVLKRHDKAELGWPFDALDVERFSA